MIKRKFINPFITQHPLNKEIIVTNRIVLNPIAYFGNGAIKRILDEVKKRKLTKAFIVTDSEIVRCGVNEK